MADPRFALDTPATTITGWNRTGGKPFQANNILPMRI